MHWVQSLDVELFRFINQTLMNPVCDQLMPFISGNHLSFSILVPLLALAAAAVAWKGGTRGLLFLLMMALVLGLGDGLICNTIKHAVARPRPFLVLANVHLLAGRGGSGSMPSSHAANWFAATMVALVYYRRSLWFMLPLALLVSFSRVYNGVHYPSDVLAGAILGAGYAVATLWGADSLWLWAGRKWFPLWWEKLPSLLSPPRPIETEIAEHLDAEATPPSEPQSRVSLPRLLKEEKAPRRFTHPTEFVTVAEPAQPPCPPLPRTRGLAPADFRAPHATLDAHWLRLGYLCIALLLVIRWLYIAGGTIQLAEDEAYQWLWSKHLALSYFSKPPLIAYSHFLSTSLWGDTAFGVRFFAPLIAALLSLSLLRFFAREVNARAGFFLVLIVSATPMLAVGAVLMTVDPLSVLFWTAAMLAGWRACQERAAFKDWLWVGLWMGLGFLSKYTALFQLLSWALFFVLWRPARKQLRQPGPYLALLLSLLCALPVLVWNSQHDWVTVTHVATDAGAGEPWKFTLRYVLDFLLAETALLNPVFFAGMVWAAIAMWKRGRHNPRLVYFFSMGAPVFLAYFLHSFKSRVLANWIAPSVLPLFCLMVVYWDARWRLGAPRVKSWLTTGLVAGAVLVVVSYNTDVVRKVSGRYLPVQLDPLHRVRDWDTTARVVEQARQTMLAEGKPAFIIADHYGLAGELSFYLPEARAAVRREPLVYCRSSSEPENQFYFWPGYSTRKGQNALYVRELNRADPTPLPPPPQLQSEFESVTDLGVSNVMYHGQFLLRPLQMFACRGLR